MDKNEFLEIINSRKINSFSQLKGVNPSDIDIGFATENHNWITLTFPGGGGLMLSDSNSGKNLYLWNAYLRKEDLVEGGTISRIIKDLKILNQEETLIMQELFNE